MLTEELQIGRLFTNYAELCKTLGTRPKSGNAKIKHLQEIALYVELEKKGRKFRVLKLHSPEEIEKRRFNYCMTNLVKVTLLEFLKPVIAMQIRAFPGYDDKTPGIIAVERNNLLYLLGFANKNFLKDRFAKKEKDSTEFFRSVRSRSLQDIKAVIDDLVEQEILYFNEGYIVEQEFQKRSASIEEIVQINTIKAEVAEQFGIAENEIAFRGDIIEKYYSEITDRIRQELGISFFTKSYTFASSLYLIEKYLRNADCYLLDKIARFEEINLKCCERMKNSAFRTFELSANNEKIFRQGKTKWETDRLNTPLRSDYLELQEELIEKYVKVRKEEFQEFENLENVTKLLERVNGN